VGLGANRVTTGGEGVIGQGYGSPGAPRTGEYAPPVRTLTLLVPPALLALLLAACAPGPAPAEPFSRDRLGQLARALESARDAQLSARDHLVEALTRTEPDAVSGMSPDAAYDLARRSLLRSENRLNSAGERLDAAVARGDAVFEQWEGQLRRYEDPDLKRAAELNIEAVRGRFRGTVKDLRAGVESLAPVHHELSDRMLSFAHHRDQPAAVVPPRSVEGLERVHQIVTAMRDRVAASEASVQDFLASINRAQRATPAP
jgi:hypothetical protein